jgi:transcriptional regulator with XRE-family HTH domain
MLKKTHETRTFKPNRLCELREARGLTQEQLAAATGIKQPHICGIERGRKLGVRRLMVLAAFFDVDARYLAGYKETP